MDYTNVNVLGVYVAPFAVMMAVAWLVTLLLTRLGDRVGIGRIVWHPALFHAAVYVIVLCLMALAVGAA